MILSICSDPRAFSASTQKWLLLPVYPLLNCRYSILCCCRAGRRKYNRQRLRPAPNPDLGVNISIAPEGAVCKELDSISWSSFPINDNVLLCELPSWPFLQQLFQLQMLEPVGELQVPQGRKLGQMTTTTDLHLETCEAKNLPTPVNL